MSNQDLTGRIMAHAFHDEMEKIAKVPAYVRKFRLSIEPRPAWSSRRSPVVTSFTGATPKDPHARTTIAGMLQKRQAGQELRGTPLAPQVLEEAKLNVPRRSRGPGRGTMGGGRSLAEIKAAAEERLAKLRAAGPASLRRRGQHRSQTGRLGFLDRWRAERLP